MAFNALEYLKDGKVDFVYELSQYDCDHLIEYVRKAPNRIEIINGFLPKLDEYLASFYFAVIYDIPEYADYVYDNFFKENAEYLVELDEITPDMLNNLLNNTPLGLKLLNENFDDFMSSRSELSFIDTITKYVVDSNDKELLHKNSRYNGNFVDFMFSKYKTDYIDTVIKYAFNSNNKQLIHKISRYKDLHTRFLFMKYLIDNNPEQVDIIYDDITKYTTSVTYEQNEQLTFLPHLMNAKDISKLAVLLLVNNRENDYEKLKDYILKEYKSNYLASELLTYKNPVNSQIGIVYEPTCKEIKEKAFDKDANVLFSSSTDYRYPLFLKHKDKIRQDLLKDFYRVIKCYIETGDKSTLETIYQLGLGNLLEEWTKKYMELSKTREYGFVGRGTTCDCFRIGDYVIKLVKTKWSYEDIICPDLYLIAKDYEELYLRNKDGIVIGGLEVQKYLTRKATDINPKYFRYFDNALDKFGYKRTDTLTGGSRGENTMLLDTYRDANCDNPEKLPVWFKHCPLVLIDRDRIYSKNKCYIKQRREGYY